MKGRTYSEKMQHIKYNAEKYDISVEAVLIFELINTLEEINQTIYDHE